MALTQLLFGGIVSLGNIAVHAIVMTPLVATVNRAFRWEHRHPQVWLTVVMIATVSVLMIAHAVEVTLWAAIYALLGVAPPGADVLYFAFVNYATLGYGDVVPGRELAPTGPNNFNERSVAFRLVNRGYFRGFDASYATV